MTIPDDIYDRLQELKRDADVRIHLDRLNDLPVPRRAPVPRPIPGTNLAVIDGDADRPLGEQAHHLINDQHTAPNTWQPADRGGNQGEKEPHDDIS